jgi:hypothetical protein
MQSDLFGQQIKLAELLDKLDAQRDKERNLIEELERKAMCVWSAFDNERSF